MNKIESRFAFPKHHEDIFQLYRLEKTLTFEYTSRNQQVIVNEGFAVLLLSLVTGDPRDQASWWLVLVRHNKRLLHFVCAKFLINFPVITRMNWNERKCLNWTGKSDKKIFGFDNWASLPRRSCFLNNACWGGHIQAALTVKMVMLKYFFSFVSFSHDFPTLFPREALRLVIWWNTRWWKSALTSQRKIWQKKKKTGDLD